MGNDNRVTASLAGNLPEGVITPLRRLLLELGKDVFSFNDIIGYIERKRQKHLRIEEDNMPAGMTGYAIGLRDCDLICTRRNLSEAQRLVTQLHEMAHFIRGDIPILSGGEKTTTYDKFIYQRDRHQLLTPRERIFEMYVTTQEHDTELLARILLQFVRSSERDMPPSAQQLYNFGGEDK